MIKDKFVPMTAQELQKQVFKLISEYEQQNHGFVVDSIVSHQHSGFGNTETDNVEIKITFHDH